MPSLSESPPTSLRLPSILQLSVNLSNSYVTAASDVSELNHDDPRAQSARGRSDLFGCITSKRDKSCLCQLCGLSLCPKQFHSLHCEWPIIRYSSHIVYVGEWAIPTTVIY